MIDYDCAIAVSTDYNPGSALCPSQPAGDGDCLPIPKKSLIPSETLNAVTINAAGRRFRRIAGL